MAKEKQVEEMELEAVVTAMEFGSSDSGERVVLVHVDPFTARLGGLEATITNLTVNMKRFKELIADMSDEQTIKVQVGENGSS